MNEEPDDLDEKLKRIAINMDEEIEPYHPPKQEEDDAPGLVISLTVVSITGEIREWKKSLEDEADGVYFLTWMSLLQGPHHEHTPYTSWQLNYCSSSIIY